MVYCLLIAAVVSSDSEHTVSVVAVAMSKPRIVRKVINCICEEYTDIQPLIQVLAHRYFWFFSLSIFTAILQVNLGQSVFIEAKDDGNGGDSWSYRSCKVPVISSPPTNQHLVFFTGRMSFLSPNQQCQNTEGKIIVDLSRLIHRSEYVSDLCHTSAPLQLTPTSDLNSESAQSR